MTTKIQREIAIKALVNELWKQDVDFLKIWDEMAYPMQGPPGSHDTYMAHEYLLEIFIDIIGKDKYLALKEKNSQPKCNFEDF